MTPNRIILIRHGQSEGNVDPNIFRSTPDYKVPLTALGKEQAIKAGYDLNHIIPSDETVRVYCSPHVRTRQTLEGIRTTLNGKIVDCEFDPRIREREWAGWFGDHAAAPKDRSYKFFYRMPDGESCADVYSRMCSFIESLKQDFNDPCFAGNALIVTHGTAMRVFLMRWFRWDVDKYYTIQNPANCGIVVLEKNKMPGKFTLTSTLEVARKGSVL